VLETHEPLMLNQDVFGERARMGIEVLITGEAPKSVLFVPLIAGGRATGVISLQNVDREHAFTDTDERLLTTLAGSLVIAFFLTMVLGLNESVSMQSMTLTIQALRANTLTRRWFLHNLRRELATAVLLGLACGILVCAIVWIWRQDPKGAVVIGSSIAIWSCALIQTISQSARCASV